MKQNGGLAKEEDTSVLRCGPPTGRLSTGGFAVNAAAFAVMR